MRDRRQQKKPSLMDRYSSQLGMLTERRLHDAAMLAAHQELEQANQALIEEADKKNKAMVELEHLANHDPLTGLPNRALFNDRLQHMIETARRTGENLALMFIDLDHFKDVNDTLGHAAGDQLLIEVARRLKDCIRSNDTVARLGGDEFAIIQVGLSYPMDSDIQAKRILSALSEQIDLGRHKVFVGASVGITVFPDDAQSAGQLQKNADMSMYQAKEEARHTFRFFDNSMNTALARRTFLEQQLRHAMDNNELDLFLQPKIDLRQNRIAGAEALIRWKHPEEGMISPEEFIPVAERIGMISPIGEWTLRKACQYLKKWQSENFPSLSVAVNLSATQFKERHIPDMLAEIIRETDVNQNFLELEVTETAIMQDMRDAAKVLQEIHDLGIHLSIDDFGTGYSSLSYLRRLPVNRIKIDRSFITEVIEEDPAAAVARAVVMLGKSLSLEVVAEGVEDIDQLRFLQELECDEAQGYYFAKPMPVDMFETFVREWKGLPET